MKNTKTFFIPFTLTILLSLLYAPAAFADVECDADGDGYVALTQNMLEEVVADNTYRADGNYTPEEWNSIFERYKAGLEANRNLDSSYKCSSLNFKKGAEPARCDPGTLSADSEVFDTARVRSLQGSKVNPGAFDAPDNGIDEDCDGADGKLVTQTGPTRDLGGLVDRAITLLGRAVAVVSIVILIWGAILYATAAGDEQKTSKARKAIIGALIGLIVGLLAPSVVNWITTSLA